ncbi:MAG TPA: 4a-hydroxytetrahydrobiopterin dehydratase [Thermomicrobiales bacterium]
MATLTSEHCVACRPDAPPVTEAEIAELKPSVPEWEIVEVKGVPRLQRTFRFRDYPSTLAFVQRLGELAESEGHHPSMTVDWGKVRVSWWTHAIRNLHRNDFIMAAKTDALAAEMGAEGSRP